MVWALGGFVLGIVVGSAVRLQWPPHRRPFVGAALGLMVMGIALVCFGVAFVADEWTASVRWLRCGGASLGIGSGLIYRLRPEWWPEWFKRHPGEPSDPQEGPRP